MEVLIRQKGYGYFSVHVVGDGLIAKIEHELRGWLSDNTQELDNCRPKLNCIPSYFNSIAVISAVKCPGQKDVNDGKADPW